MYDVFFNKIKQLFAKLCKVEGYHTIVTVLRLIFAKTYIIVSNGSSLVVALVVVLTMILRPSGF